MRTLAHISDLHYGTEDPRIADALLTELRAEPPSVIAISGDLTQRARPSQFAAARRFLDQLPSPYVVVPGNHDVPLWNVIDRFWQPLDEYRRHITDDLSPVYRDDELVVIGVNTARALTWKDGRLSVEQIIALYGALKPLPPDLVKVVVSHHQFVCAPGLPDHDVVGRAEQALAVMDASDVDLLLAGHLHRKFSGTAEPEPPLTKPLIVAQCGTTLSTRVRGEANSYNWIELERDRIAIALRAWNGRTFQQESRSVYVRGAGWHAAADQTAVAASAG